MAGESCNLNKDEGEILKPSSPPSHSSPPPPPPPSSSTPQLPSASLFLKPPLQEFPHPDRPGSSQTPPPATSGVPISCPLNHEDRSQPSPSPNRCSSCQKRVRLTGFRCRCGELFCACHRYSDTHDCSFDYKAAGREQIAKDNPLIRAAKIIKI